MRALGDATPGLDASMVRFLAAATELRITVHEHPGPHAFDLVEDSAATREAIERVLGFLRDQLTSSRASADRGGSPAR